jgi:hypothetical protein
MSKANKIPLSFHLLYLILAAVLCYIYFLRVIAPADFNSPNSINSVLSFETGKPYQFRLFIPFIFFLLKPLSFIPEKTLFLFFSIVILYGIQLMYYRLLRQYFENNRRLLIIAPVILYTIFFNYVVLNQTLQFYDFTSILICIFGLYFIVKENFPAFVIVFFLGLINKESAAYLIFSYLLFNYKDIFTLRIISRTALLALLIILVKTGLSYIFRSNPGDNIEICVYENIRITKNLFSEWGYLKPVLFNFGALYLFAILLFARGWWRKFPDRRKLLVNLAIVPFYIFGIFITYIVEVRVYTELIPMITTLFLIYLSNFKRSGLVPAQVKVNSGVY